jgi:hypothetical protein|tara:strand:+ start:1420 stop:1539 length:120 start_codon:yes stop_codon:yes gene_type:complete
LACHLEACGFQRGHDFGAVRYLASLGQRQQAIRYLALRL